MEEETKVEGTVVKEENEKELVALKGEIMGVIQQAHSLIITDDITHHKGFEIGGILTKFLKLVKDKKKKQTKSLLDPVKEYIKNEIDIPFNKIITPLEEAKTANDDKVKTYQKLKEEKAAKKQEEIRSLAKEKGVDMEAIPIPSVDKTVKTDFGSATAIKRWDCEMVDFSKVLDKHKLFNKPSVMKEIHRGIRNISGVRIFQRTDIRYK